MVVRGLGLKPESFTVGGAAQADAIVIKKLAGDDPSNGRFGTAFDHFKEKGDEEFGR